jgi:hypothetical protein
MFKTQPVDESFFHSAPFQLRDTCEINRPASQVWTDLTKDDTLSWCRILDEVTWTSPRPFGVGTTRTVKSLKGASLLNERYFRWEEGHQMSFYVVESSAPLFKRFAEDYIVEPASDNSCRFSWTIAVEPHAATKIADPANRKLLGTLFSDTRKHYGVA